MTQEHPITPPPELVQQWNTEAAYAKISDQRYIATQAARWGADQELEACCEYLTRCAAWEPWEPEDIQEMRDLRRPKPPNLKEQALQALAHLENGAHCSMDTTESAHYIRRALESLPD
jgi:exonuclease V gamma subunit